VPVLANNGIDPLAAQPAASLERALSDNVNIVHKSSATPKNSTRFDVNSRLNGEVPLFMINPPRYQPAALRRLWWDARSLARAVASILATKLFGIDSHRFCHVPSSFIHVLPRSGEQRSNKSRKKKINQQRINQRSGCFICDDPAAHH